MFLRLQTRDFVAGGKRPAYGAEQHAQVQAERRWPCALLFSSLFLKPQTHERALLASAVSSQLTLPLLSRRSPGHPRHVGQGCTRRLRRRCTVSIATMTAVLDCASCQLHSPSLSSPPPRCHISSACCYPALILAYHRAVSPPSRHHGGCSNADDAASDDSLEDAARGDDGGSDARLASLEHALTTVLQVMVTMMVVVMMITYPYDCTHTLRIVTPLCLLCRFLFSSFARRGKRTLRSTTARLPRGVSQRQALRWTAGQLKAWLRVHVRAAAKVR